MSMNRHDYFEELISASLAGDLSDAERQQLDAHLDSCAACRATLASFADQRRIMAGLRHLAPPRDLSARVRSGIETGAHSEVPWWRRPAFVFAGLGGGLAAVAGALLAIVLLNGAPDDPEIGGGSESPAASVVLSPAATAATPTPAATPASAAPSATPAATPIPEVAPEPDAYLAYTGPFDNLALMLRDGATGEPIGALEAMGPPIAAELSPNGQFLAYITQRGQSGMNEVWVTHLGGALGGEAFRIDTPLAEWQTVPLGESMADSPFLEHLAWSTDSRFVAFTLADTSGAGTDVWLYLPASDLVHQLTSSGSAYNGSWVPSPPSHALWVSIAGDVPMSYLLSFEGLATLPKLTDPAESSVTAPLTGVFQPLVSPDGSLAIYWNGVMAQAEGGVWTFVEAGAPYLAEARAFDNTFEFVNERPLFGDVTIDRDAFMDAAIVWGADSDAYAVWRPRWTGTSQAADAEYPNTNRVYFGHASDPRGLTSDHAIDEADYPQDRGVVDVKVPTARHLLITVLEPIGGILAVPLADLILVTRNTGDVADVVETLAGADADGWYGPGAYDATRETSAP
jgi:hypothetical protein